MTQTELDHAVARATGESLSTVKRLGFLLADGDLDGFESEYDTDGPQVLDWDEIR